jgi:hypothetical protein
MGLIPLGILSSAGTPAGNVFPSSIPDLVARYDAMDLSSISLSGSDVTQWNDLSGNARHATQGTSTNRPKSGTRTINGKNVIDFDGTNDYLINDGVAASFTGEDKPYTVFLVQQKDTTGRAGWVLNNTASARQFVYQVNEIMTLRDNNDVQVVQTLAGSDATTALFSTWRSSGLSFTGWINKTLVNTGTSYNIASITLNRSTIGATASQGGVPNNFGNFYDGAMGELIYYNRQLTTTEVTQVQNYLSEKWGI